LQGELIAMDDRLTLPAMLRAQWNILVALMLRDIKTRFFGNAFGFLIAIAWPLSHILILLGINAAAGRAAPYGESGALWFATGIVPFMAFSYMSRFIMMGIVLNRPLLTYPAVKITDILFARAIIEVLSAGTVVLSAMFIFWMLDIAFMPIDLVQACLALGASMILGLGFGVINAIIAAAMPAWITGYALFTIVLWMASGVLFVPDALPELVRYPLSFNPMLHGVEWMRASYYEGYGATILDKTYMIAFALICLFTGLALERLIRGKLLEGN
jgi:capsular polysaccharide transport system permease protein